MEKKHYIVFRTRKYGPPMAFPTDNPAGDVAFLANILSTIIPLKETWYTSSKDEYKYYQDLEEELVVSVEIVSEDDICLDTAAESHQLRNKIKSLEEKLKKYQEAEEEGQVRVA